MAIGEPAARPGRQVYLDNLNTTSCLSEVVEAMLPFFMERFRNPSSFHPPGREAQDAVKQARRQVAALIGAREQEVFFTSSSTEANNWAMKGILDLPRAKGRHIVTSKIEHTSILAPLKTLERRGLAEVTYGSVDSKGFVDPDEVKKALRPDTALVSIGHASNEIGTIEPIIDIARVCTEAETLFHVDATMTAGYLPLHVLELGVDMLTLSCHTFYGPKGAGALYCRRGVRPAPLLEGGSQEEGRRAGTENVAAIVGMGKACELAKRDLQKRAHHYLPLRDRLIEGVLEQVSECWLTGDGEKRLPHHASFVVRYVEGEGILLSLIMQAEVFAASGSACTSKLLQRSHVLEAIGIDASLGEGSLIFGIGLDTTVEDVDRLLEHLPRVVQRLRSVSPLLKARPEEAVLRGGG